MGRGGDLSGLFGGTPKPLYFFPIAESGRNLVAEIAKLEDRIGRFTVQ